MSAFNEIYQQLQARQPPPPLYPTSTWNEELSAQIAGAGNAALFGCEPSTPEQAEMMEACRAGLLLWNDDLEASHHIAQSLDNPTGSFWHAIMHRREGDAANSHYWWRRTKQHPAFADVHTAVMSTLEDESGDKVHEFAQVLRRAGTWQPMEFVARCELARRGQLQSDWLQRVQVAEMQALLNWCRAQAG